MINDGEALKGEEPQGFEPDLTPRDHPLARRLFDVIFGHTSRAGKAFDVILIAVIALSIVAVMLESVAEIRDRYGLVLRALEWTFTAAFTVEYLVRLWVVKRRRDYALSFFGLVDLLSVIPTYLSLFVPGANTLLVIRVLRILRVFRILKLVRYIGEANLLADALLASRRKILVFLFAVLAMVVIFGAIMYVVEGAEAGYTSIPKSMYWAIVTLTTVGYGDISPATPFGQMIASVIMIMGYGIIAVPTGIYTAELSQSIGRHYERRSCPACHRGGHEQGSSFCRHCGHQL